VAVAVDASTPVRWTGTPVIGANATSASFTAPADALLVCCVSYDTNNTGGTSLVVNASDSGGLTWTRRVERQGSETTAGGGSAVFTARTTSSVARTVGVQYATGTSGQGTGRLSAVCYVLTGVDVNGTPVDAVTAANEGGSATNDLTTTSVTPGATGLLVASDTDWNQLGLLTSSDLTIDSADYAGAVSVASGYKACTSGVAVSADLNAGGTAAAQHKWCQVVVRAAAGAPAAAPQGWQGEFPTGAGGAAYPVPY
jgi:hypothetical protein